MLRPLAAYRELAEPPPAEHAPPGSWWTALRRPLFLALLLGSVLSFVTAGRLTLRLVLGGALAWSFLPALQLASVSATTWWLAAADARRRPWAEAVDLYFMGHGPWSFWLLLLAATQLGPATDPGPWPRPVFLGLLLSLLATFAWAGLTTFAFFRAALEMSRGRALAGLALHTAIVLGSVLAFFFGSGQFWPRVLAGFR